MARSYNTARSKTSWTEDRQAHRAQKGKETKSARKNERRDIEQSMTGVTYRSFGEHYEDGHEVFRV